MSAVVSVPPPRLRPMVEDDLVRMIEIEIRAYEFPWTLGIFRDCLRYGYVCRIYEDDQGVTGYGILSIAAGECHLLNICIDPHFQGRGYGTDLVTQLLDVARAHNAKMAFLEVRASNSAAYHLYNKLGFNEMGVRKNYYPTRGGREDAILLAREL